MELVVLNIITLKILFAQFAFQNTRIYAATITTPVSLIASDLSRT